MEYIINIIYKFIKNYESVKILGEKDDNIYYYYLYKYKLNDNIIYCYLNLQKFFSVLITLLIFFIFLKFNICIIPLSIINYILFFLSISFIINILLLILNIILGLWKKLYQDDDELFDACLTRLFSYINFLINISFIYYIFDLDINFLLQYNILFVIDYLGKQLLWFYSFFYKIKIDIKPIQNFINYPFLSLIILKLSLYNENNFKYWWCVYLSDFVYIFNFELPYFNKK